MIRDRYLIGRFNIHNLMSHIKYHQCNHPQFEVKNINYQCKAQISSLNLLRILSRLIPNYDLLKSINYYCIPLISMSYHQSNKVHLETKMCKCCCYIKTKRKLMSKYWMHIQSLISMLLHLVIRQPSIR
jgi:hypothetical protein